VAAGVRAGAVGGPGAGAATSGPGERTFRRAAGTRILSALCAAILVFGALSMGAASGLTAGTIVLIVLALLALANVVSAYADRYTLGASGLEYGNLVLSRLGMRPRRVPWEQIVLVREHRRFRAGRIEEEPSALFLTLRSGRRVVLDSLEDYDEVLRMVRRRCGAGPGDGGGAVAR